MDKRIESWLDTEFEQRLYSAAVLNLRVQDNPLRLNNYSYAIRELIRHVLYRISSDEKILQCQWYTNETNQKDKISRSERIRYAIHGGMHPDYIASSLGIEVEGTIQELLKRIRTLSKYTHIQPQSFDLPPQIVKDEVNQIEESLIAFFSLMEECKKRLIERLFEHIDNAVFQEAIGDTISEIDELATHYYITEVIVEESSVDDIGVTNIIFGVDGSISCLLQWGSNSDMRNDIGYQEHKSFPLVCNLESPVGEPDKVRVIPETLVIDTIDYSQYEDMDRR